MSPRITYFKPRGIPMRQLQSMELLHEEFEALRLKDYLQLEQKDAAKKMGVSQSTFQRMLFLARKKVSQAIVDGKAIAIKK